MGDHLARNGLRRPAAISILLFCVVLLAVGCAEPPPEKEIIRPVRAVKVQDAEEFQRSWNPGRAKATQEIDLAFRVDGPLIERPVDVGTVVQKGDLVARIDPRDFEVALDRAKGELSRALATAERAKTEYERERSIFQEDPGATSKTTVARKREQRDSALANVQTYRASVSAAEDALQYTYLRAPFDGRVVATYVENYEDVRAKQPVVRIVDTSKIEMVVNIPERLITVAPYVRDVRIRFDAYPDREFKGTIKEIGTEASQTTRTYPITLIMDQPEDVRIEAGMAGKATAGEMELPEVERAGGVIVPVGAVFSPDTETRDYVWVVEPGESGIGTVSRRKVEAGKLSNSGQLIESGLTRGEWIVTAGVHSLKEGQKVRLLPHEGA
jgi:RND family efflux transporter MFP subunit